VKPGGLPARGAKVRRPLPGHTGPIRCLAFAPDGGLLASGAAHDGDFFQPLRAAEARVWDTGTGKERAVLRGHGGGVWSVAFARGGQLLAPASDDTTVRLWDVPAAAPAVWRERQVLKGYQGPVWSLSVAGDDKTLATGGHDATVYYESGGPTDRGFTRIARLWDLETGQENPPVRGARGEARIRSVALQPDGRALAVGWEDDNTVVFFDIATRSIPLSLHERAAPVYFLRFSPDGRRLLTSCRDQAVKEWSLLPGEGQFHQKRLHGLSVAEVLHAPSGKVLAVHGTRTVAGAAVHEVRLLDPSTGKELAVLRGKGTGILAIDLAGDGKALLIGGADGSLRLVDLPAGKERWSLAAHNGPVRAVALSAD